LLQEQERDVPEHKVELLNLAAESLKSDLHFERLQVASPQASVASIVSSSSEL